MENINETKHSEQHLRRNSYQLAIHRSNYHLVPTRAPFNDYIHTARSMQSLHEASSHCTHEHAQQHRTQSIPRGPVDSPRSSSTSPASPSRLVIRRLLACALTLASLSCLEALQISIYSNELTFPALTTFHLTSFIVACLLAAHTFFHQRTSDGSSNVLLMLATACTSAWVIVQYFPTVHSLVLIGAGVSGMGLSCMRIKTFDHFTHLTLPAIGLSMERRLHQWMFIDNTLSHLALPIGGLCLFRVIVYEASCFSMQTGDFVVEWLSPVIGRNATAILMEGSLNSSNAQMTVDEPVRHIVLLILLILIVASVVIQATTPWKTLSPARVLEQLLANTSALNCYRHYVLALFIGFQDGYVFGSMIKVSDLHLLEHSVQTEVSFSWMLLACTIFGTRSRYSWSMVSAPQHRVLSWHC